MQDVISKQNVRALEGVFDQRALLVFSSQIFKLGSFSIDIFYFVDLFIHILIFASPKSHFYHSIKDIQSLKIVWKCLIT